ncbi:hypothetical protein ACFSTC_25990 [Nonomuraea ferruginea]
MRASGGAGLRGRQAQAHAMGVLERVGLAELANTAAGRLALLQRKRLEVARAVGTGPRLLLLDEVAGGLTEPEVAELVAVVRELHAGGLGVVWIEHVVHALVKTVGRMICLAGGVTWWPTVSRCGCWPTSGCVSSTWAPVPRPVRRRGRDAVVGPGSDRPSRAVARRGRCESVGGRG